MHPLKSKQFSINFARFTAQLLVEDAEEEEPSGGEEDLTHSTSKYLQYLNYFQIFLDIFCN